MLGGCKPKSASLKLQATPQAHRRTRARRTPELRCRSPLRSSAMSWLQACARTM